MFNFLKKLFSQEANEQIMDAVRAGALLVDVRTPGEFASGSVKGALNVPLDQLVKNLSVFKEKKGIVLFCRSGNRSGQAKNILKQNGIQNVINGGTWMDVNKLINNK